MRYGIDNVKSNITIKLLEGNNFNVPMGLLLKYCDIVKRMDQARGCSIDMYAHLDKERAKIHDELAKIAGVKDKHDYTDEFNFWLANEVEDYLKSVEQ